MIKSLSLNIGLRRTVRWVFIFADIKQPIIEADFLRRFILLVDITHKKFLDATTFLSVNAMGSTTISSAISTLHEHLQTQFDHLLSKYPSLTRLSYTDTPFKHDVTHIIKTKESPVFSKARR